ncbi:HK97 gp10 family phage protein [Sphingomonas sp. LR60]|uniref:HK97 gp10 family phage protein n=1 Tax=Sphingomonas sp. LR60 TaxID=3050233 RepID=UPI002FE32FC3
MTVTVKGLDQVQRYIRNAPTRITRVLQGAGRISGKVVGQEAQENAPSDEVEVTVAAKALDGRIKVRIDVAKGWGRSLAIWAEYGTAGHYISVDARQSGGRTARRTNKLERDGVLVINGQPVGKTVWHPGAKQEAFMRPALDKKRAEAIRAGQAFINEQVRKGALAGRPIDEVD